ncbi:hypothetical protein D3C76_213570 [compost metagenome]
MWFLSFQFSRPDGGKITYTYDVRGNRQTLSDTNNVSLDPVDTSYAYDLLYCSHQRRIYNHLDNGMVTSP